RHNFQTCSAFLRMMRDLKTRATNKSGSITGIIFCQQSAVFLYPGSGDAWHCLNPLTAFTEKLPLNPAFFRLNFFPLHFTRLPKKTAPSNRHVCCLIFWSRWNFARVECKACFICTF
ncbi:MAG TPA: hypothetical protein VJZ27_16985, partial [Aggregatilineales bacterium]|nr:hypothetical protein [Aggregatilineales bacterium]